MLHICKKAPKEPKLSERLGPGGRENARRVARPCVLLSCASMGRGRRNKKCLKRDTSDTRKRETGNSSMGKRETDYLNYSRYNAKMQALMERNLPVFEENLLVFDRKCGLR